MERQSNRPEFLVRRNAMESIHSSIIEKGLALLRKEPGCVAKVEIQGNREECSDLSKIVVFWEDMYGEEYWPVCGLEHAEQIEHMAVKSLTTPQEKHGMGYSIQMLPTFTLIEENDE